MMSEDKQLAVQPKAFVTTTDSNHALEVYLNLARRMKLTGIDQLCGLKRRPFPRPHPGSENQRDDRMEIGSRSGCRNL